VHVATATGREVRVARTMGRAVHVARAIHALVMLATWDHYLLCLRQTEFNFLIVFFFLVAQSSTIFLQHWMWIGIPAHPATQQLLEFVVICGSC
jgi:hypothetical protein